MFRRIYPIKREFQGYHQDKNILEQPTIWLITFMRLEGNNNEPYIYGGTWISEDVLVCIDIYDFEMVSKRRNIIKDLIYELILT